jgi:hypothetical protein
MSIKDTSKSCFEPTKNDNVFPEIEYEPLGSQLIEKISHSGFEFAATVSL